MTHFWDRRRRKWRLYWENKLMIGVVLVMVLLGVVKWLSTNGGM